MLSDSDTHRLAPLFEAYYASQPYSDRRYLNIILVALDVILNSGRTALFFGVAWYRFADKLSHRRELGANGSVCPLSQKLQVTSHHWQSTYAMESWKPWKPTTRTTTSRI
jgi:hypothetical protein